MFMAWFGGWRSALIGTGVLTIVIGLLAWWVIRGNPATNPRVNDAERTYLEEELNREYRGDAASSSGGVGIKQYARSRSFWLMCVGWFAYCTVYYGLMTWGPMFLAKTQNLNINSIGTSIFIIFGAGFVGELIGGWIADFWRQKGGSHNTVMRTLLSVAGIVTGISIFLLGHITSLQAAITLLAIALFFLRWTGLYLTVPAAISQRQHVGMVAGCMSFLGNISGIITPICIGFIVSATNSYFIALMLFAVTGFVLAVASMLINYAKKIGVEQ
jgi:ACS family D-galactonate transporter-like MFS transporter